MKKGLIGIQMSTIKNKVPEIGAYETLRVCAEMGYHCMEVSQIAMTPENVSGMRKACDDFGNAFNMKYEPAKYFIDNYCGK